MSFEKGDTVVLHDEHSEYDGQIGEVSQVSETMFGDATYMIQFEDGQEAGISEDAIEAADAADDAIEAAPDEEVGGAEDDDEAE